MSESDTILPEYQQIQNSLTQLNATTDCAEAHGSLCGLLIDNRSAQEWLASILDKSPALNDLLAQEHIKQLTELYETSKLQLNHAEMSFNLLLPSDDSSMNERLQSLADWCQGFLYGLGSIAKIDDKNLQPEVKELLSDLLSITQVDSHSDSTDESELSYAEIVEYVRMGVIYLNEVLNPSLSSSTLQ